MKWSRCREDYDVRTYHSRMGICRWCEEDLITLDRELSRQCGLRPMGKLDVDELNKYWQKKKRANKN